MAKRLGLSNHRFQPALELEPHLCLRLELGMELGGLILGLGDILVGAQIRVW